MAAVGFAIALLSALLIQEPAREFSPAEPAVGAKEGAASNKSGDDAAEPPKASAAAVDAVDQKGAGGLVSPRGGGEGGVEQAEDRESFQEALRIVFQSNTARLVSVHRCLCVFVFLFSLVVVEEERESVIFQGGRSLLCLSSPPPIKK